MAFPWEEDQQTPLPDLADLGMTKKPPEAISLTSLTQKPESFVAPSTLKPETSAKEDFSWVPGVSESKESTVAQPEVVGAAPKGEDFSWVPGVSEASKGGGITPSMPPAVTPTAEGKFAEDVDARQQGREFHEQRRAQAAEPAPERGLLGEALAGAGRGLLSAGSDVLLKTPSWIFGDVLNIPGVKNFFAQPIQNVEMAKGSQTYRPGSKAGGPPIDLERIVSNPGGTWEGVKEVVGQVADNVTNAYFWASQLPEQVGSLLSIAVWSKGFQKLAGTIAKTAPALEAATEASQAGALWGRAAQMGINKPLEAAIKAKNYAEVERLGVALATGIGAGANAATMGAEFAKVAQITNQLARYGKIGMYGGSVMIEAMQGLQALDDYEQEHGTTSSWGMRVMAPLLTGLIAGPMEAFSLDKLVGMFKGSSGNMLVRNILQGIATEGITETMQTIAENAVEKYGFNPDKKLLEGVVESALLGAAMGGLGGGGGGITTELRARRLNTIHQAWLEEQQPQQAGLRAGVPVQPNYATGTGQEAGYGPQMQQMGVSPAYGPQQGAEAGYGPAAPQLGVAPTYGPQLGAEPGFGPRDITPVPPGPSIPAGITNMPAASAVPPASEVPAATPPPPATPLGSNAAVISQVAAKAEQPTANRRTAGGIPIRTVQGEIESKLGPAQQEVQNIRESLLTYKVNNPEQARVPLTINEIDAMAEGGFAGSPASLDDIRQTAASRSEYQNDPNNTPALPWDHVERLIADNPNLSLTDLHSIANMQISRIQAGQQPLPIESFLTGPQPPTGVPAVLPKGGPVVASGAPSTPPVAPPAPPTPPMGSSSAAAVAATTAAPRAPFGIIPPAVSPTLVDRVRAGIGPSMQSMGIEPGFGPPEAAMGAQADFGPSVGAMGAEESFGPAVPPSMQNVTRGITPAGLAERETMARGGKSPLGKMPAGITLPEQPVPGPSGEASPTWRENISDGVFAEQVFHKATEKLATNQSLNINDIKAELRSLKGDAVTSEEWTEHRKAVEEAVELAFTWKARELVERNLPLQETLAEAKKLYDAQPNLTSRTSTSIQNQAYSTPLHVSVLLNWLITKDITPDKIGFDPTAGNGMLLIGVDPQNAWANEINPDRLRQLAIQDFKLITDWDATTMADRPDFPSRAFHYVMANPPFGNIKKVEYQKSQYYLNKLEHLIALNSLEAMRDDGKAFLIIGGHSFANLRGQASSTLTAADKIFFNYLYNNYNVTAHVNVDGSVYRKMGTSFPIRIIMIEGRLQGDQVGQRFAPTSPGQVTQAANIDELAQVLSGGQNAGSGKLAIRLPSGMVVGQPRQGITREPAAPREPGAPRQPGGPRAPRQPSGEGATPSVGSSFLESLSASQADIRRPVAPEGEAGGQEGGGTVSPPGGRPGRRPGSPNRPGGSAPGSQPGVGGVGAGGGSETAGGGNNELEQPDNLNVPVDNGPGGRSSNLAVPGPGGRGAGARNIGGGYSGIEADKLLQLYAGELSLSHAQVQKDKATAERAVASLKDIKPLPDGTMPVMALEDGRIDEANANLAAWAEAARSQWTTSESDMVPFATNLTFEQLQNILPTDQQIDIDSMKYLYWRTIFESTIPKEALTTLGDFKKEMVEGSDLQARYTSASKGPDMEMVIPHRLAESVFDSLARLEADHGPVDPYVAGRLGYTSTEEMFRYLGNVQIDTLALAIAQIEQGNGLIVGHQTGVGKGRVAAGVMAYARQQGLKPIFFTSKPNLFSAMFQDCIDIGRPMRPLIIASDGDQASITDADGNVIQKLDKGAIAEAIQEGRVPDGYDAVFCMYTQTQGKLNFGDNMQAQRGQIVTTPADVNNITAAGGTSTLAFGKMRFIAQLARDNIIILDESHNAAGVSNRGEFFNRLIVPYTRGIVYSSATFAKDVANFTLYSRTALGATPNIGTVLMRLGDGVREWLSQELARNQQMINVQPKLRGTFNFLVDSTNEAEDIRRSNVTMQGVRDILDLDQNASYVALKQQYANELIQGGAAGGTIVNSDGGIVNPTALLSNFASTVHNLVSQVMFMMRTQPAIDSAIRMLQGTSQVGKRKPIITVYNTMDAVISYMVEEGVVKPKEEFTATFHDLMRKVLDGTRRISIKPAGGGEAQHYLMPLSYLDHNPAIRRMWDDIQSYITREVPNDLPLSPIDEMTRQIRESGFTVGEITGRKWKIEYDKKGKPLLVDRSKEDLNRNKILADYNNGQLHALIINSAGAEGMSAHASPKFQNQEPRGMITAQFAGDINIVVQLWGRINRTGQVQDPAYEVIVSALPSENRPIILLQKKLASLSGNITGNVDNAYSLTMPDIFNLYGDEALAALLIEDPMLNGLLGNPVRGTDTESYRQNGDFIRKFSGRLALLNVAQQRSAWDDIQANYEAIVDHAKQIGEYTLDTEDVKFNAVTLERIPVASGTGQGSSALSQDTVIEKIEVDVLKKPWTRQEIIDHMKKAFSKVVSTPKPGAQTAEGRAGIEQMAKARARGEGDVSRYFTGQRVIQKEESYSKLADRYTAQIMDKLRADTVAWANKVIASHPEWTPERVGEYRQDINNRYQEIGQRLNSLKVGKSYFLRVGSGDNDVVPAVLVDIKTRRSRTTVPVSSTLYSAVFAVNSTMQRIEMHLNKTGDNWNFHNSNRDHLLAWDDRRAEATKDREIKYVVTGNLLALPENDATNNYNGRVIYFTRQDGSRDVGVLLNRRFNWDNVQIPVTLNKDQVWALFNRADGHIEAIPAPSTRTNQVEIRRSGWREYQIKVPSRKDIGGRFYLDDDLRALVNGREFRKAGGRMIATFTQDDARNIVNRVMELGAVFQVSQQVFSQNFAVRVAGAPQQGARNEQNQISDRGNRLAERGQNYPQDADAGRRLFGDTQQTIASQPEIYGSAFEGAEHAPEVLEQLQPETYELLNRHGVNVLPVKNAQVDGIYLEVNGAPVVVVNSDPSRGGLDGVIRHEVLHHLVVKGHPDAVKLMQAVDFQTGEYQAYKQAVNDARVDLGLLPLDSDRMAEEFAADTFAGLTEFFFRGRTYAMADGYIDSKVMQGFVKDIAGKTVAEMAQAGTQAATEPGGKLAIRIPFLGARQQPAPPGPQPTRGPYRQRHPGTYQAPTAEGWKAPWQALKEIFAAETVSEWAKRAHSILVKHMGLSSRIMAQKEAILREYRKDFNQLSKPQFLDFMDAAENGMPIPAAFSPRLQDAVNKWRVISDELHVEISNRSGGFFDYVEDYMARLYKRPEEAVKALQAVREAQKGQKEVKGGGSLTGPASFKKPRTVDFMSVALTPLGEKRTINGVTYQGLGLESKFPNYVDSMLANVHEKLRYIMGIDMFNEWRQQGLIVRHKNNQQPSGWVELTDKKFQIWHYSQQAKGRVKRGAYFAPTDVARIINNYLSPGMRGNALYDAYRNPTSFINSVRVGLSAFHAAFTIVSDLSHGVGSNLASAFESAIHGRFSDAAKDLKDLGKVFNVIGSLRNAEKLYQEYLKEGTHPQVARVMGILSAGGMRIGATPINEMSVSFADAWRGAKTPEGWAKIPRTIMEGISWPIMGWLVPRAKLNATYRMFMKEMEKHDRSGQSLTDEQQIQLAQEVVKNIDNIFGQLVYDNLALSRWMKDTLHVFVGFPGWNIGSFRTMGGTGRAVGHIGKEAVKAAVGLATGRGYQYAPMDTQARFGLEKTVGMLAVVGMLGALTQLLMTGRPPEDPYDLFFPQTGNKLPNGQPERIRWPSYLKDYLGMAMHPYELIKGKLNWPLHIFAALADNVDYAGRQVRDPEAPFFTQGGQLAKYIGTNLLPFSIQGYQRGRSQAASTLSLIGLTPAPKAFSNTDAANVIDRYYGVAIARTLTPKQVRIHDMKMELMDELREGNKGTFKTLSQEYMKTGQLTRNQVKEVIRQAAKPSLVARFERMPLDWELKAWEVASPDERKAWEPILAKKVAGAQTETLLNVKEKLLPVLREIGMPATASKLKGLKVAEGTGGELLEKAGLPRGLAPSFRRGEADRVIADVLDKKMQPKLAADNLPSLKLEETKKDMMRRIGLGG